MTADQRLEFVQRLGDPEQIIRIGTYFLDQFLDRFEPELAERHITHPIRLGDQTKVLNAFTDLFTHPEQLPPNMVNALLAILEFSAPHNRRLCEKLAGDAGIDTSRVPEGWALALWLRAPYDLQYVKTLQAHIPDNFYDNDIEYEDVDESPNGSAISPTSPGPAQPANGSAAPHAPALPAFEVSPCPRNKIARLPKDVRNAINEMIAQGLTYHEILHHLGDAGKTLNKSSLWRWKKGPYQRWLKNQERLDESRAQLKFALDAVRQNENNQIHQATQQIAALRISEIFTQFDLQALKEALVEKPDTLVRLAQLLPKLSQGGLQCERQRHELTQAAPAAPAAPAQRPHGPLKRGISNKALRYAQRKLRLM